MGARLAPLLGGKVLAGVLQHSGPAVSGLQGGHGDVAAQRVVPALDVPELCVGDHGLQPWVTPHAFLHLFRALSSRRHRPVLVVTGHSETPFTI